MIGKHNSELLHVVSFPRWRSIRSHETNFQRLVDSIAIKESLLLLQIDFFNKPRREYLFSEEGTVFNENAEYWNNLYLLVFNTTLWLGCIFVPYLLYKQTQYVHFPEIFLPCVYVKQRWKNRFLFLRSSLLLVGIGILCRC